jgi:NADH-quinone oxidoreductase subunit M
MITAVTFLPALTALVLVVFLARAGERLLRLASLLGTLVTLGFALVILFSFKAGGATYAPGMTEAHEWIPSLGISYKVGVDGISLFLVVLTALLAPICILCSWHSISRNVLGFHCAFLTLETGMMGVFVAMDLILFYVFWEVMYFLIGVWGSEGRVHAALKFFLYTIAGSLLMFLAILYLYVHLSRNGSPTFDMEKISAALRVAPLGSREQMVLFLAFAASFAIKVPLFPFHTWLPDAHTEAPTAGSVVLAGVLLKMGTYGFLRLGIPFFPEAARTAAPWISALAIAGIIFGACMCFVQDDLKRLVAYSSVSHMGFVMLGIFAMNPTAIVGSVVQMVNHGLSTGALFLLVGLIYERRHTRKILDYGGIARVVPRFSAAFMIATLSSIGLPGLNGFVGEFLILQGTFESSRIHAALGASGIVLGAVYMLQLCRDFLFGPIKHPECKELRDLDAREVALLAPIMLLMVAIGMASPWLTDRIAPAVAAWLEALGGIPVSR